MRNESLSPDLKRPMEMELTDNNSEDNVVIPERDRLKVT